MSTPKFVNRDIPQTDHWDEMSGMRIDTTLVVERVVVEICGLGELYIRPANPVAAFHNR